MQVIYVGDIKNIIIGNISFVVKPDTTCTIRPSINKFSTDTEIKTVVNSLGVRNYQTSKIATCGFKDLEVVLTPKTERALQIMIERKLILPVLLELQGGLGYQGDLYLVSELEIDAANRTAKISMSGNSFIAVQKRKQSLGEKIVSKLKEIPK